MIDAGILRPLRARIANMLKRAAVIFEAPVKAGDLPRIQVTALSGEVKDNIPVLQPHGFFACPLPASDAGEAETVLLALKSNHTMALAPADRRFMPTDLAPGEAIVYTDEDAGEGFRIHLKRGRQIKIVCADADVQASGDVTVNAGDLARIDGNRVRIRAASSAIFECAGHGFEIKPDRRHDWNADAVSGTSNNINPPEIPES